MVEIRRFLHRLVTVFRSDRAETDLTREVNAHLQLLEDKFIAQGMSTHEARFAARRAFGGVEQTKEHQRDMRSFRSLDGWRLDVKLGALLRILVLLSSIALLLSLAGIYAVMSFTVSRRTREIGIRVALGANRTRLVVSIFRRPLAQVALGVAVGGSLVFVLTQLVTGLSLRGIATVVSYMVLMMAVCTLACIVPTRRALSVQPTDALKQE